MKTRTRVAALLTAATIPLALAATLPSSPAAAGGLTFDISRLFIEYNSSGNDLGFHTFLDGEDWVKLKILRPDGETVFEVEGDEGYEDLGLTELFFEGAEPSLDEVPLEELFELFPEGKYKLSGKTVDGQKITGTAKLTHAVPDAPEVFAQIGQPDFLQISWNPVSGTPPGFPNRKITISGYQVIVGSFQVTLPGSATSVTVPPEYVNSLGQGPHGFEVLAIEAGGNQTITEGEFVKP